MGFINGLIKFFQDGGFFLYPLVIIFVVGVAIAIERWVYLTVETARNRSLWDDVAPHLGAGNFKQAITLANNSQAQIGTVLKYGLARLSSARRRDDIQQAISSGRTRIRIGTMPSAMTFTAAAVARYTKVHGEQVEVVLSDMSSDALLVALSTGELDFCICTKLAHSDLFESVTVLEDELVLVVSQQHPLAKMGEVPWRLLAGEEILLFNKGSIWDLASVAMRQHGLAPTKLCQVVHSESLYGIVRAQIAVGIMCSLYTASLMDSSLHVAQLRAPMLKREIVLMRRNDAVRNNWADHCFIELNKDLKQVNRWF